MGFELSEEQQALRERARAFAQDVIAPQAAAFDESGEYPMEILKKSFELGFMNDNIPAEYGGPGHSCMDLAIVTEELGAGCMGMATSIMANALALTPIVLFGNEEQKQKYLARCAKEFTIAAFCLTEREAGSDAAAAKTFAVRDGDDYVINGSKCFSTNGGYADIFVVFALADKDKGARSMSAFIVEKDWGVKIGKAENKMGQRASNQVEVHFEDVRVPACNLLEREGKGFRVALATLDKARVGTAAGAVGLARRAMVEAVNYARERHQFDQPLAMNQAIQFKLADMAMKIEAARLLTWQAGWMADQGMRQSKQSAFSKCFAGDVAMEVTTEAVQIFGGNGYSKEYPVEKLMRDAKLMQIYEGTQEIQRLVIAREMLFKGNVT
ncbi:MAG: acyl-CoA dehydrogenase family protein [Candidatus Hydrogenedentes bacterium]|nr:acyl-CoA dehydrogenase family protein [Candidatus Hydrogenedentota bacterium]